jgi:hypothetical protein
MPPSIKARGNGVESRPERCGDPMGRPCARTCPPPHSSPGDCQIRDLSGRVVTSPRSPTRLRGFNTCRRACTKRAGRRCWHRDHFPGSNGLDYNVYWMNRWRSVCPMASRTLSDMLCGPTQPPGSRSFGYLYPQGISAADNLSALGGGSIFCRSVCPEPSARRSSAAHGVQAHRSKGGGRGHKSGRTDVG